MRFELCIIVNSCGFVFLRANFIVLISLLNQCCLNLSGFFLSWFLVKSVMRFLIRSVRKIGVFLVSNF